MNYSFKLAAIVSITLSGLFVRPAMDCRAQQQNDQPQPANNEATPADASQQNAPAEIPSDPLMPAQPAFLTHVAVNRDDGRYSHGERLAVRFKSEREAHVYLLYHQADGKSVLIFPNQAQADNLVPARTDVSIPKPGDSFRFRIAPPYGQESLQVIASAKPIELLDKLEPAKRRATSVPMDTLAALADAIKSSAGQFAEHRVVIHTEQGGGPLPKPRDAARYGLFIGVDQLQDDPDHDTPMARASAEFMRQSMIDVAGLAPDNTQLLVGKDATTANFEDSLTKWLPSVTQPGDIVYLFYCGHGGQVEARDQSEPDGLDEYLTTYDVAFDDVHKTGVTDDRLARWLQELPGRQLVLLLETCHGGGVVDGKGMAGALRDEANRVHDISGLNTIVVCACLPDEYSNFSNKLPAAFMPVLFDRAMRDLPKPVSAQAAYAFYRENLPKLLEDEKVGVNLPGFVQQPSITDHALLPVLLVPAAPADPSAPTTPATNEVDSDATPDPSSGRRQ